MRSIKYSLIALGFIYGANSYAEAQVVDATPIDPQQIQAQAPVLSLDQRVARLEQQLQNRQQLDLAGQISSMQQAVQDLRGQIDILSHQQKQLEQRLNDYYQDLNKRIDVSKNTKPRIPAVMPVPMQEKPIAKLKPVAKAPKVVASAPQPEAASTPEDDSTDNFPIASADNTALNASASQPITQPSADTQIDTVTSEVQEQNAYQTAYNSLKNRNYAQAITAMESYLQQYPNGKYAASAHYWLGELYMVQGQIDKAASQFSTIITRYPRDSKAADATLKLGMVYYNKGQYTEAKQSFEQVKAKYPGTAAARLADARLQEMSRNSK